ncbi:MAG TPA: antitoxin [Devosia sp.]|nr:antitoxin [Devosia sp.]
MSAPQKIITTSVKKSGGSLVLTVPAPARDALRLAEGQQMTVSVEDGKLVYEAAPKRRRAKYTLEQLLAQCDPDAPLTEEERNWLTAKPVGGELW